VGIPPRRPRILGVCPDFHNVIHNTMRMSREALEKQLNRHWYARDQGLQQTLLRVILRPLEWLYRILWAIREWRSRGRARHLPDPIMVIAVGNLVSGGAGKTPATLALASALRARGVPAAIICRAYRAGDHDGKARTLGATDLGAVRASEVGDEAMLLAWRSRLPVGVGRNRLDVAHRLLSEQADLRALLIDDGLQQRDVACQHQLLVIDKRGFGNRRCLPAGPLREPPADLRRFTGWIGNALDARQAAVLAASPLPSLGGEMKQTPSGWINLAQWDRPDQIPETTGMLASQLEGKNLLAVAGIASPAQFFDQLTEMGFQCDFMALPDHDPDTVERVLERLKQTRFEAVLMTEKDAVKFFHLPSAVRQNMWALRLEATLPDSLVTELLNGLKTS
jgi:tetraacyldisaccharide 4'-kinase